MPQQKVLVVGGTGYFGRLLINDLLQYAGCEHLVVASRRSFQSNRFETVVADLWSASSLENALAGVSIAVCAAGPFQQLPTTLAELCVKHGIHYVDLADNRSFVRKVRSSAPATKAAAICTGWSTVSALSGALVRVACRGLRAVDSIYIHMAPGNRGARQTATIASLMHSVGQQFMVWRNGAWCAVRGWSEPREFRFPAPVGVRRGYLVDAPDHELFPELFGAGTVEFRVSSELWIWNRVLSLLRWSTERRIVRDWVRWSELFQRAGALLSWIGHSSGGVGVEVCGSTRRRTSIVADSAAERMAVMPASIMVASLLAGREQRGLLSPADWITEQQLAHECDRRGFRFIAEEF
jgi:hypothetical protein